MLSAGPIKAPQDNTPLTETRFAKAGASVGRDHEHLAGLILKTASPLVRCVDTVSAARPEPAWAVCLWERLDCSHPKVRSESSISALDCDSDTQPLKPTIPLSARRLRQGRRPGWLGVCTRSQSGKCRKQSPREKQEPGLGASVRERLVARLR